MPLTRRELALSILAGTAAGLDRSIAADDVTEDEPQWNPVDAQMAILAQRYPMDHLTPQERESIRQDIQRRFQQSVILQQYPLAPSEDSGLVFAAYRGEE